MYSAVVQKEVTTLTDQGTQLDLVEAGGQCYARIQGLQTPCPPWGSTSHDILIAMPLAYDQGAALDGFYLGLPYTFNGGVHPRVQGSVIVVDGREWRLVSWHYSDGKPWRYGRGDNLASHIVHCKGFFANRGAVNGY